MSVGDSPLVLHSRPTLLLAADDPAWQAAVARASASGQWSLNRVARWTEAESAAAAKAPRVLLLQLDRHEAAACADWLAARREPQQPPVAVLLARRGGAGFTTAEERQAAAHLFTEAGARICLASPRQLPTLWHWLEQHLAATRQGADDPLDDLPLACWNPAWQRGA